MKKSIVILLHVGFWLCYFMLIILILGVLFQYDDNEQRIEYVIKLFFWFAIVPSAITFYSFYFLLFPKYILTRKFFPSILFGLLIPLGSALVGYLFLNLIFGEDCLGKDENNAIGGIFLMFFIALISGIIAVVIKGFITWVEEIKLKETLKQKNHEMEMALIKSQLDPHFLFNTINNIDILILKNATQASEYLNKLSDIMRFMLYETKADTILLSKEIEYIEKYIELQKIRTSNSNYVNFSITGMTANKTIVPMVFIPFIENAFKHTTNKKIDHAISINILIENETIKFVCENKYNPNSKKQQENNGLGNKLIQKRLSLIYPEKHKLEIINQNNFYGVYLTIYNG